ncbi:hypothetical protein EV201_1265 [Ancylomarina subtilis]|uniref:Phage protein n=1 Tax=Ancylomarina subtilis TaxID=1639035 RepID=A0A4Q7VKG2_9BACT|nr:hypothetical protein [Ancylomarina subtilis]RZT96624.1 hypothetical protein EV201_1265 [Ancylomarina subtilis]
MQVSLYEITEKLKEFGKHPFINQVQTNYIEDYSSDDLKYPLLWLHPSKTNKKENANIRKFDVMIIDRMDSKSDPIKQASDIEYILGQFITEFRNNREKYNFFLADKEHTFESIIDSHYNNIVGYKTVIRTKSEFEEDENETPLNNG